MELKNWRLQHKKTLKECAGALGLSTATAFLRYEDGSHRPPAVVVEAILNFTGGCVTAQDMHAVRLAWENNQKQPKEAAE